MSILNPQSKLFWHGDRVKSWLEGATPSPVLVEIAPTGFCNASCPWCFFKDKRGGSIDTDVMLKTLNVLKKMGVKAINWTGGGEPTLYENLPALLRDIKNEGLLTKSDTNGSNTTVLKKQKRIISC